MGSDIPEKNIQNILHNAEKSYRADGSGYQSIIHVDFDNTISLIHAQRRLAQTGIEIKTLKDEAVFKALKKGRDAEQYNIFRLRQRCRNYAAASDILRYHLLNEYGGIYMDVDDAIQTSVVNTPLLASDTDLLINGPLQKSEALAIERGEINTSTLASHPHNPVLKGIIKESSSRFKKNKAFFEQPRPSRQDNEVFSNYMKKISEIGGPRLFNDILKKDIHTQSLYELNIFLSEHEKNLLLNEQTKTQLNQVRSHYMPFSEKWGNWKVKIGSDNSWTHTR